MMNLDKPVTRSLPVALTLNEKAGYGRDLASLHYEYGGMELKKKASADQFKNELEMLDGRIAHLAGVVRAGEEYRSVECRWRYLFDANTKELIRMDTGEIVETTAITSEERQLMLQMEQEKEASSVATD